MEIVKSKQLKPGDKATCCENTPQYVRGKPGPSGDAATIEIAEVVTVEPSDPAEVKNIGDSTNAKLVFYIPKGDQGNPGRDGGKGEPGNDYVLTEEDKREIASMIEGGGSSNPGEDGGYYTPKVTQLNANTMSVSFTASDSNMPQLQSVDVTLPKGEKGDKGDKGDKGETGAQGIQGIQGVQGAQGAQGAKGDKGDKGDPGDDYVLTEADKQEIAGMVEVTGGTGSGVIAQPDKPTETDVLWLDTDEESDGGGGSSVEWNIRTLTTTEETALVRFDTPTEYEEIRFFIEPPTALKIDANIFAHGKDRYVNFYKKPIHTTAQRVYNCYLWHVIADKVNVDARYNALMITGGTGSVGPWGGPGWASDITPRIEFSPNVSGEVFPVGTRFGVMWR